MPAVKLPQRVYSELRIGAYEDTLQAFRIALAEARTKLAEYKRDRERLDFLLLKLRKNRLDIDREIIAEDER